MQQALDFGLEADLTTVRDRLAAFFGPVGSAPQRTPIAQLVKSLISNHTYDKVSLAAFERLTSAYAGWPEMAAAPTADLERLIARVEYWPRKAEHLAATLRRVAAHRPDFDLSFLHELPMSDAKTWLERMPGVGPKVSASVLNFSTLDQPAFVIDTHVKRVLERLRFVRRGAPVERMYDTVMGATSTWSAVEFADLHAWMKRLGQTLCRPTGSRCDECPIRTLCKTPQA